MANTLRAKRNMAEEREDELGGLISNLILLAKLFPHISRFYAKQG